MILIRGRLSSINVPRCALRHGRVLSAGPPGPLRCRALDGLAADHDERRGRHAFWQLVRTPAAQRQQPVIDASVAASEPLWDMLEARLEGAHSSRVTCSRWPTCPSPARRIGGAACRWHIRSARTWTPGTRASWRCPPRRACSTSPFPDGGHADAPLPAGRRLRAAPDRPAVRLRGAGNLPRCREGLGRRGQRPIRARGGAVVIGAARIDHLVVAADSLAQGAEWCDRVLGVVPGPGGEHPLMGTHNRLLRVATVDHPRTYFEIIARNPEAAPWPAGAGSTWTTRGCSPMCGTDCRGSSIGWCRCRMSRRR